MASTVTIDLRQVARGLDIPLRQIQAAVELLDEGNTVPFITRYRKDQTGGLDEEQIRDIQVRLGKARLLADRKQTILRSIEAQGKLTEKLAKQIQSAATTKRLEDLYLPYKPKKQTLATLARSRGLEELACEILAAAPSCADLDARARDFANPDRQVPTAADALLGAGHILAEQFSERAELRQRLREILQRTGRIITAQIGGEAKPTELSAAAPQTPPPAAADSQPAAEPPSEPAAAIPSSGEEPIAPALGIFQEPADEPAAEPAAGQATAAPTAEVFVPASEAVADLPPAEATATPPSDHPAATVCETVQTAFIWDAGSATEQPAQDGSATVPPDAPAVPHTPSVAAPAPPAPRARKAAKAKAATVKLSKKELKKKRMEERRIKAFRDYFDYREEVRKIPPHRILAINRGERARVLRVKMEYDLTAMYAALDEALVAADHPHADYLRGCARDSLNRLVLPALEREYRRELTDRAEAHAVSVFAKNLRNLLLQPPIHNRRVLAVDPGFKSGCKLAALDEFGNVLGHDLIYLVGKPERRAEARQKSLDLLRHFELSVVAIGNGTACREAEDFFAELIEGELKGQAAYVIVNEAGASAYSTSQTGREEFPDYDASLRGGISIGRRLQDPLSELVKIDPASIGVGLYQHDVKAKHLRTSLDEVVESCVNYVGVDVNTASPALLRYVSGLNQLTARRVYEYRRERGPFRNRQQLREVPGFGEATFVQAAGFLKIAGGDNPLDATWIHPESYAVAAQALEKLGCAAADLAEKDKAADVAQRVASVSLDAMAKELGVGLLTLKDILAQLARPGRDPREDLPPPVFKQGVLKIEDLTPGMELTGTVLNVVDFGCFVDIGMHDSGLVHVSRLADRYIRDPHEVVAVGEVVQVWVLEVDKERRRVSLTMVRPGSERPRHPAHGDRRAQPKPPGEKPAEDRPARRRPPRREGGEGRGEGRGGPPRPQRRPAVPQEGGPRPGRPPQAKRPPAGARPPARPPQPKPRPKPMIPITDAMKTGKEPMRTFGDLLQFYAHKGVPGKKQPVADQPCAEEASAAQEAPPAIVEAAGEGQLPAEPVAAVSVPEVETAPAAAETPDTPSTPPPESNTADQPAPPQPTPGP